MSLAPLRRRRRSRATAPRRRRSFRFGRRYRRGTRDRRFPLAYLPAIMVPLGEAMAGAPGGYHTGIMRAIESGDMNTIMSETKNILPYELIGYGYEGKWHPEIWLRNGGLIVGGALMDKAANALGLNAKLKRLPLVGKYLKI